MQIQYNDRFKSTLEGTLFPVTIFTVALLKLKKFDQSSRGFSANIRVT